ncbi:MAG: hypothetical protein ACOYEV_00085 [Candidatus Nanopelagicales bacterium]
MTDTPALAVLPASASTETASPALRWPEWIGRWATPLSLAVVFVADFALLAVRSARVRIISPFDEGYHLSYLEYVYRGSVPATGSPLASWSQRVFDCWPTFPFGRVTANACGVFGPLAGYPEAGTNTSAVWPPGYYITVATLMRPFMLVTDEPLIAARLASALVFVAGAVVLACVALRLSGSHILAMTVGIMCASLPGLWQLGGYLTPHAAAPLAAAGLAWWLLWVTEPGRGVRSSLGWSALAGFLAMIYLPHSIGAVVAVVVAATALAWRRRADWGAARVPFAAGLGLLATAVITNKVWGMIVSARALGGPGFAQPSEPPEGVKVAVLTYWDAFWPRGIGPGQFLTVAETQWTQLLIYIFVGLLGYWLLGGAHLPQRALAGGIIVAAPLAATYFAYTLNYAIPLRYGASLVALSVLLLAIPRPRRSYLAFVGALTTIAYAVAVLSIGSYLGVNPG